MSIKTETSKLSALEILSELKEWLSDNCYMQSEPPIVAYLADGSEITQIDCINAINTVLGQLETKGV